MKLKLISCLVILVSLSTNLHSQDKLFYNRIHYFEHLTCQHPIGTIIQDKVFFANNTDNSSFLNFNNSENEIANVDLINYGKYTAFNQFFKTDFLAANTIIMGFPQGVSSVSQSIQKARNQFRLDKVKDTLIDDKKLKHIRIKPKDTLVHRFKSYNILINSSTDTETPLYRSPTIYFLLMGSLKDLKGTVVETYFIDLQGYWFCRDVLSGFEITNKRVIVK
ncbi:hypothetical protein [Psychroflexus sediminis]|uniref:Uncharacterized protein n=1 Tax=Psychroflexus sediminis TaxID=470826 RepID=A0A1G7YTN6_9FLAO|nr:hypothetical protein [Psychroflexus sediminis]SDG99735.1 hypothetical protein SAMN04488027_11425 [Psychroflexus sediminis]